MRSYLFNKPKTLPHESIWKTDNAGTSNNNQITLPLTSTGTYNMVVDWGDGSKSNITVYNSPLITHTYPAIGTYTIKIYGVCNGFRFNNGGDKLKILEVKRWGKDFRLGNDVSYFYGCSNLVLNNVEDTLNLSGTVRLTNCFRNCTSITTIRNINRWDLTAVTTLTTMFYGASSFNDNIGNWNIPNVTSVNAMFQGATNFNQPIGSWNMGNVTDMSYMLFQTTNFNQSIGSWNIEKVATMDYALYELTSFNQNISNWNPIALTTAVMVLYGSVSWSTTNYDALLISWAGKTVKNSVAFRCSSKYSAGAAATARGVLTGTYLWTITDLGQV